MYENLPINCIHEGIKPAKVYLFLKQIFVQAGLKKINLDAELIHNTIKTEPSKMKSFSYKQL
jgi:hypothetical protein